MGGTIAWLHRRLPVVQVESCRSAGLAFLSPSSRRKLVRRAPILVLAGCRATTRSTSSPRLEAAPRPQPCLTRLASPPTAPRPSSALALTSAGWLSATACGTPWPWPGWKWCEAAAMAAAAWATTAALVVRGPDHYWTDCSAKKVCKQRSTLNAVAGMRYGMQTQAIHCITCLPRQQWQAPGPGAG